MSEKTVMRRLELVGVPGAVAEGKRERKKPDFFKCEVAEPKAASLPKGKGVKLKDIPNVSRASNLASSDDIWAFLYKVLFGRAGKVRVRKSMVLEFSGLQSDGSEEDSALEKLQKRAQFGSLKILNRVSALLDIPKGAKDKNEKIERLVEFLKEPKILSKETEHPKENESGKPKAKTERKRKSTAGSSSTARKQQKRAKKAETVKKIDKKLPDNSKTNSGAGVETPETCDVAAEESSKPTDPMPEEKGEEKNAGDEIVPAGEAMDVDDEISHMKEVENEDDEIAVATEDKSAIVETLAAKEDKDAGAEIDCAEGELDAANGAPAQEENEADKGFVPVHEENNADNETVPTLEENNAVNETVPTLEENNTVNEIVPTLEENNAVNEVIPAIDAKNADHEVVPDKVTKKADTDAPGL